jgi:hypothetical protein
MAQAANRFLLNSNLGYGYSLAEVTFGTTEGLPRTPAEKFPRALSIRYEE